MLSVCPCVCVYTYGTVAVFLLDPWWNPAVEMQAIQRAHRIGQTRVVEAIRFCTTDSIEDNSKWTIDLQRTVRFSRLIPLIRLTCPLAALAPGVRSFAISLDICIILSRSDGAAGKEAASLRRCGGWKVQRDGVQALTEGLAVPFPQLSDKVTVEI